jgi:glutamate-1-semialdehyde aminotransferase
MTTAQLSSGKLSQSRAWLARAAARIPSCAQTFSKSPISFMQSVSPNFLERAEGAYVWDVDGNRYIDFIMGLGPVILGHSDAAVNAAVFEQMRKGVSFSLPHPIEVEAAELLCEIIPCAEMVRFGKNGSDVTAAAVRVSRGFTRRDKVARCGYHGWQDWFVGSTTRNRGVPEAVQRLTLRFPYNDLDALNALFAANPGEIACVIMEPVVLEEPRPGYLEQVRETCHANGALLVFDEVVTGFRLALGGAQQHYGVTPDLACFGKAMGNGFPIAAIAGRADVMRLFEEVFFSFTHGGEAASLAACMATIGELQRRDGIATLWRTGRILQDAVNHLLAQRGLDKVMACAGLPPRTGLAFRGASPAESHALRSLFQQEAIRRGILTHGGHMLSLAHTDTVIEEVLRIYEDVFAVLADAVSSDSVASRLEGPPLEVILRDL